VTGSRFASCCAYARFGVGLVGTFVVTAAAMLLLLAIGPALVLGWDGFAMRSGSMTPAVERGDILLTTQPRGRGLATGSIVVFRGPDDRAIAHRIVGEAPTGAYITRGDANRVADSDPLPRERVSGVGRLLVPFVGLPFVWWREGNVGAVVLVAAVLLLCAWAALGVRLPARAPQGGANA